MATKKRAKKSKPKKLIVKKEKSKKKKPKVPKLTKSQLAAKRKRSRAAKKGWETRRENERKKELAKQIRAEARRQRKERLEISLPRLVIAATEDFKRARLAEEQAELKKGQIELEEAQKALLFQQRILEANRIRQLEAQFQMERIAEEEKKFIQRRPLEEREYYQIRLLVKRTLDISSSQGTFEDDFEKLVELYPEYTQSEIYTMYISDLDMLA